jgi:hypothetical protein
MTRTGVASGPDTGDGAGLPGGRALFSFTAPMNPHVAAAIQAISDDTWQPIRAAVVSTVTLRRFRS